MGTVVRYGNLVNLQTEEITLANGWQIVELPEGFGVQGELRGLTARVSDNTGFTATTTRFILIDRNMALADPLVGAEPYVDGVFFDSGDVATVADAEGYYAASIPAEEAPYAAKAAGRLALLIESDGVALITVALRSRVLATLLGA